MSVSILESPNTLDLFCNNFNCNDLLAQNVTFESESVTNLFVNQNLTVGVTATVAGDTVVTVTAVEPLRNKTIDSSQNTLTITNSPLNGVNVNSLINQDVRTTANTQFNSVQLLGTVTGGGIPAQLNWYEEFGTPNNNTYTGIWAVSPACTISVCRIGKICVMHGTGFNSTANTSAYITTTVPIPARFVPSVSVSQPIAIMDAGSVGIAPLIMATNGIITIQMNYMGATFSGTGSSGVANDWFIVYSLI